MYAFFLMFMANLAWTNAFAACSHNIDRGLNASFTLPAQINLKGAAIGDELATFTYPLSTAGGSYYCTSEELWQISLNGLEASTQPKVYRTNIKGIGIRVGLNLDASSAFWSPPFSWRTLTGYAPKEVKISLVRTDIGVASGKLATPFNVTLSGGGLTYTIRPTNSSTHINNEVLFAGCTSVNGVTNVPMGLQTIDNLQAGKAENRPFNFDIRCEGLNPNTSVPVKVYFEGNSSADGLLALSGSGQPSVASGVGIALVSDKGVKLPFAKARSIRIEHRRSEAEGEIYRFSGIASYVRLADEIKPGKADASMTYVIDYN